MTDGVDDMHSLTLVDPEVVGDIILDLDDEKQAVLDRVGEFELVTETVACGLEEEDTDVVPIDDEEIQALTLVEPEDVGDTISDLDVDAHAVFEWECNGELVAETVVHELEEEDLDVVPVDDDDMQALSLTEPEFVGDIISDVDDEALAVFEWEGEDELVVERVVWGLADTETDAVAWAVGEILVLILLVPHIELLTQLEADEDTLDDKEDDALTLFDSK